MSRKKLSILWFDPPSLDDLQVDLPNADISVFNSNYSFEKQHDIVVFDPKDCSIYGEQSPRDMFNWVSQNQPDAKIIAYSIADQKDLGLQDAALDYVQGDVGARTYTLEDLGAVLTKHGCKVNIFAPPWAKYTPV